MYDKLTANEKDQMVNLLKQAGSTDENQAFIAQREVAAAIQTPLRQGILTGSILDPIYTKIDSPEEHTPEFPIDLYRPDNAGEFTAYVIPNQGRIPERHVEGDYVRVPTFEIGNSIDFLRKFAKNTRWDVVRRALEVMEAGVIKKKNDDGFHAIMSAAFNRNIIVGDVNAVPGQFTKRLVSLMKLVMRRNAGGNSTSINRGKLTHLFISPEAIEDIRNWGVDQVDEVTRRDIFTADDGGLSKIYQVALVDLDELGEDQEYQDYYVNTIAAASPTNGMVAGDNEIVIGIDRTRDDSFVHPVHEEMQVFPDPSLHRQNRMGWYTWGTWGFGVLNGLRTLVGSF